MRHAQVIHEPELRVKAHELKEVVGTAFFDIIEA